MNIQTTQNEALGKLVDAVQRHRANMAQWEIHNPRPVRHDFLRNETFTAFLQAWESVRQEWMAKSAQISGLLRCSQEHREAVMAELLPFIHLSNLQMARNSHANSLLEDKPGQPRFRFTFAMEGGMGGYFYTPGAEYGADHCGVAEAGKGVA